MTAPTQNNKFLLNYYCYGHSSLVVYVSHLLQYSCNIISQFHIIFHSRTHTIYSRFIIEVISSSRALQFEFESFEFKFFHIISIEMT